MDYNEIKASDIVGVARLDWQPTYEVKKVDKVTKSHILIGNQKFRRSNGFAVVNYGPDYQLVPRKEAEHNITLQIKEREAKIAINELQKATEALSSNLCEEQLDVVQAKLDALSALI